MIRSRYSPLASRKAGRVLSIESPSSFIRVTLESPAISVMTDLRQVTAATVAPGVPLAEARRIMGARNVRLLLAVDEAGQVAGLITARDTEGEHPIQWLHDRGGTYADLRVADLMTPADDIDVLDLKDVLPAAVGHVVATLKQWGRQHALVAEREASTGDMKIRGIFSATQISRHLGIAVQPFDVANTFADIERSLAS
jgi:CBS domain-containing protein